MCSARPRGGSNAVHRDSANTTRKFSSSASASTINASTNSVPKAQSELLIRNRRTAQRISGGTGVPRLSIFSLLRTLAPLSFQERGWGLGRAAQQQSAPNVCVARKWLCLHRHFPATQSNWVGLPRDLTPNPFPGVRARDMGNRCARTWVTPNRHHQLSGG